MERRTDIDLMRGAAMVCVMLGHIFGTYLNNGNYGEYQRISQGIFDAIYSFHMPFMFVISGYVEHMVSMKRTNKQSLLRLTFVMMVPYIIFSCITVVMNGILGGWTITPMSFLQIFVEPVSGLWFLYALFLFKVLEMGIKHIHMNGWIVGVVSLCAMLVAAAGVKLPTILYYVCAFGFSYYMGYVLYDKNFGKMQLAMVTIALIVGEVVYYNWNEVIGKTIAGVCLFVLLERLLKESTISVKSLQYIGLNCMVFYVIDGYTNGPTMTLLWKVGIVNFWIVSVITLVVKLLIPYVIVRIGQHSNFIMGFFYPMKWRRK